MFGILQNIILYIHNLCMLYYDGHLEIQDGRQTNQPIPDLIADNIFRILSIKNVGKATNYYFKILVKSLLTGNA